MSGVDIPFFEPLAGNKIFGGKDMSGKIVYTFAGALGYRKGIHLIVESFPDVLKEVPNAHLMIAGSGEYENKIRSMIDDLRLVESVTFVPWLNRDGLKELLSVSDIFLYPSIPHVGWEEQFGYSMAEASLMELPVISTRSGSIDEVVINNETGILVEPNNADELKSAMVTLGKDGVLRNKLGKAGRKFISDNFSYEIVAEKFNRFFSQIIGE
jgi:phosphatidylinositol alpha-1,6-mannosyltransferase